MSSDFYASRSLNVETYSERTAKTSVVAGDVAFFLELAREARGETLELGCGPGRLVLELARSGMTVTGLDLSVAMLEMAAEGLAGEPEHVRERIRFVQGDMSDFELDQRFGLIFIAFRSFQMLSEMADQRRCLERIYAHLEPGGTLAIDIFDPLLELLADGPVPNAAHSLEEVRHPVSGNRVTVEVLDRTNHSIEQWFVETWRFSEIGADGTVLREEDETLRMRWIYRNEMRYLLELCGFEVVAEYSDYRKLPPAYGKEQIWVARRPVV